MPAGGWCRWPISVRWLAGNLPAPDPGRAVVLATVADRWLALEVDDVDAAPDEEVLPPPEGSLLAAWALGVVRMNDGWIPILNLDMLAERLQA